MVLLSDLFAVFDAKQSNISNLCLEKFELT